MLKPTTAASLPFNTLYLVSMAAQSAWWLGKKIVLGNNDASTIQNGHISTGALSPHKPSDSIKVRPMSSFSAKRAPTQVISPAINKVIVPKRAPHSTPPPSKTMVPVASESDKATDFVSSDSANKNLMGLLPIIAVALKGHEKHLENITIKTKATQIAKHYRIGLGNDQKELGISFQTQAGKSIKFSQKRAKCTSANIPTVLEPQKNLLEKLMGPFSPSRNSRFTKLDIVVEDLDNPALRNGPKIHPIVIAPNQVVRVIHCDPKVKNRSPSESGDASRWSKLSAMTLDAREFPDSATPMKFPLRDKNEFVSILKG